MDVACYCLPDDAVHQPTIPAAAQESKSKAMTKCDLLKILDDVEDGAQLWVQSYNQTATGKMSSVAFAEVLGDKIQQEGAKEGDLVLRIG